MANTECDEYPNRKERRKRKALAGTKHSRRVELAR